MIDFGALLFDPIYDVLGVAATITPVAGEPVTVTILDKTSGVTSGVMAGGPHLGVPTMKPAADVRVSDLEAAGLTREDLHHATIAFNGATWRVENAKPRPSPNGEAAGELRLILLSLSE